MVDPAPTNARGQTPLDVLRAASGNPDVVKQLEALLRGGVDQEQYATLEVCGYYYYYYYYCFDVVFSRSISKRCWRAMIAMMSCLTPLSAISKLFVSSNTFTKAQPACNINNNDTI
jgi:hypothetical protein